MEGGQEAVWLTVKDITDELRVHEETVRRWIREGKLPAIQIGSRRGGYRVKREDLDSFVQEELRFKGKAAA